VNSLGKLYLSVNYGAEFSVSRAKRPKKARGARSPKKRLRVDKDVFDGVLEKMIQSKPVKREG
jgi:hypothetical protein